MSKQEDILVVEEVCVSCRALGRRLESVMIMQAVHQGFLRWQSKIIRFLYKKGERNQPALTWIAQLSPVKLEFLGGVQLEFTPYELPTGIRLQVVNCEIFR